MKDHETLYYATVPSPVGDLFLVAGAAGLRELRFERNRRPSRPEAGWREGGPIIEAAARQLDEYFAGKRRRFDLALEPIGTEFQMSVWRELQRIPYGTTIAYGDLARRIKRPKAVRAVGAANGKNPISVVIPCHRVIGRDGTLTGFGGGLDAKQQLLTHESADGVRMLPIS